MTRTRTLFALLVVALLAAMVAPAGAARSSDPRAARDAARARKAKLAAPKPPVNKVLPAEGERPEPPPVPDKNEAPPEDEIALDALPPVEPADAFWADVPPIPEQLNPLALWDDLLAAAVVATGVWQSCWRDGRASENDRRPYLFPKRPTKS